MTVIYTQDFESTAVGSLPAGWTAIVGTHFAVENSVAISGTKSLWNNGASDGDIIGFIGTGTATPDMELSYDLVDDQSVLMPAVRCDSALQNGYFITTSSSSSGGLDQVKIFSRVAGTFTQLGPAIETGDATAWPTSTISWRVNITGQRIRLRWWRKGTTEPSTWLVDYTDSTNAVTTGSHCGWYFQKPGGPNSSMIDNFNLDDLQAAAASDFTISGSPQTVAPGATTGNYTITPNGIPASTLTIALSDSGGGAAGVFKNSSGTVITSLTFTTATAQTFTYTPNSGDTTSPVTITATASGPFTATHTGLCNLTLPCTGFTLTPSTLSTTPSAPTGNYTAAMTGGTTLPSNETIALSDGGMGGTFTPSSLTFTNSNATTAQTFTYSPASGTAGDTITLTAAATGQFSASHTASCVVNTGPAVILITDPNIFFSPYNWRLNGSTAAITVNPGAYIKMGFTGTSCKLNLDISLYASTFSDGSQWPKVRWSVDNGPFTTQQLDSGSTQLNIASSLAAGNHTLYFCLVSNMQSVDRWVTPNNSIKVTGFVLDSGAATVAPTLNTLRALIMGDSITEGVKTPGLTSGNDVALDDSQLAYSAILGQGLGSEYGQVGFGGLGWSIASSGGSPPGAPPFFTPGNDANSSWNKYTAGNSRLVGGLFSPAPDIITICLGTNDRTLPGSTVQASVTAALPAIRAAAPGAWIFVIYEFTPGNMKAYVQAGFNAYQSATPDAKCVAIEPNVTSHFNLSDTATDATTDGLHPTYLFTGQIAGILIKAIQTAINGGGSGSIGVGSRGRIVNGC